MSGGLETCVVEAARGSGVGAEDMSKQSTGYYTGGKAALEEGEEASAGTGTSSGSSGVRTAAAWALARGRERECEREHVRVNGRVRAGADGGGGRPCSRAT